MTYKRNFTLDTINSSLFLFGPRMTGKTTLLRLIQSNLSIDLLDPEIEMRYRSHPSLFWEACAVVPDQGIVVVDEIQKIPELLNFVQMGIDRKGLRFVLSGSSARKLRRGGANLLGGRALDKKLHPLTCGEMGNDFNINHAISQGTLPKIATLWAGGNMADAQAYLRSYVSIYIKEEIQAEALTRNVGAFQRFLSVAAQSNGQVIEFSNIARECSVPASTVKEYYQIIEDTLLGFLLWPFDHNERKKARPKHYFFDTGVVRAMQGRLVDAPTPMEYGFLFETWFINECIRLRDYAGSQVEFSFWRKNQMEIDLLLSRGGTVRCGVECKTGSATISADTVSAFRAMFPGVDLIIASLADEHPRKRPDGVEILPWKKAIERIADYL